MEQCGRGNHRDVCLTTVPTRDAWANGMQTHAVYRRRPRFGRRRRAKAVSQALVVEPEGTTSVGMMLARPEGFEPPTPWSEATCSSPLSYGRVREEAGVSEGIRTPDLQGHNLAR